MPLLIASFAWANCLSWCDMPGHWGAIGINLVALDRLFPHLSVTQRYALWLMLCSRLCLQSAQYDWAFAAFYHNSSAGCRAEAAPVARRFGRHGALKVAHKPRYSCRIALHRYRLHPIVLDRYRCEGIALRLEKDAQCATNRRAMWCRVLLKSSRSQQHWGLKQCNDWAFDMLNRNDLLTHRW